MDNVKKHWNKENLDCDNTDEFKYLEKIDSLEYEASEIKDNLSRINMCEHYNIKNNKEAIKEDFSEIQSKLEEISELIKGKLKEIKER